MKIETNYEKFPKNKEMRDCEKTESIKQDMKRKQDLEKEVTEFNKVLQKHIISFLAGGNK